MCRGPVPHTPRFGWGEIIPDIYLILCFTHFSQSPRGSRGDPGRIQWISANMASPRGAPRLKNKSVRLLPGPGGTSQAVTNASDPGLAGSDAPPGLAKHLLRCLSRAKSKPSSLKTKNGPFFREGLSWRSLPTASQWSSSCQPRCCLDNTSSSPGICRAGFRFKTGRFGSFLL